MVKSKAVRDWLNNEPFFLSNGDELKQVDLTEMQSKHEQKKSAQPIAGTIALTKVQDPQHYGVPVVEQEMIKTFIEKPENPPGNHISSGLYLLEPAIFDYQNNEEFEMIEQMWNKVAEDGKLHVAEVVFK